MSESDFQLMAIGYTQAASLSEGKCDAVMGYLANEPIQLEVAGIGVDVLRFLWLLILSGRDCHFGQLPGTKAGPCS